MAWSYDEAVKRREAEDEAQQEAELEKEVQPEEGGFMSWVRRLPKNIAKGTYLAALNTIDAAEAYGGAATGTGNPNNPFSPSNISRLSGIAKGGSESEGEETAPEEPPSTPLSAAFPEMYQTLHNYADEIREDATLGDGLVQGATQFVLPFAGWLKMLGGTTKGQKLGNVINLAGAEAITAGTAFEPDEGRLAELVEFGRQMDNKYGEFLNKLVPDESLLNRYIDWMTADRESESDMEARFKNAVDSLAFTGTTVALVKTAGKALKAGRTILAEGGAAAGTPARQRGMVTFHGSPHPRVASNNIEDLFSLSNIGTGEGNQALGWGLYFAEHPQVAKNYVSPGDSRFARVTNQMEPMTEFAYDFMEQGLSDIQVMEKMIQKYGSNVEFDDVSKALKQARKLRGRGGVFEVDIPDETVGRFLDRDAQFDAQPENVKQAIAKAQDEFGTQQVTVLNDNGQLVPTGFFDAANGSGSVFYNALSKVTGSDEAASRWLAANGVPGLQFKDAQSRVFTGQGGFIKPAVEALKGKKPTRNFVLFDPQEIKSVKQGEETLFTKGTK